MDVYTVEGPTGNKVNVRGTVYLNGKPVESKSYDVILWLAQGEQEYPPRASCLENMKVLVLNYRKYREALILKDLGYAEKA